MDITEYLDVFIDESTEHLDVLSKNLLELEKRPTETALLEEIFRAAHTMKGMAATMGYQDLANLTHKLENVFDGIRSNKQTVDAEMMDVLFAALDALNGMVEDIAANGNGKQEITNIVDKLEVLENGSLAPQSAPAPEEGLSENKEVFTTLDEFELAILAESRERGFFHYEITVHLQEGCLLKGARVFMVFEVLGKFGEVIKSFPTVNELEAENFDSSFVILFVSTFDETDIEAGIQKVSEVSSVAVRKVEETKSLSSNHNTDIKPSHKNKTDDSTIEHGKSVMHKTIRVNIERLDALMNLFEELVIDRGRLEQISNELKHPKLTETVEKITRVSGDLQDIILTLRMVPIDQVFSRFPRMIRQLARDLNKEIKIDITGAETELDRTVIDEIGDPLVHLIRNALDHGIELPAERVKKRKPKEGTLKLTAYHSGNHIYIEIADDGAGINKEKVQYKAIQNDILTHDQVNNMSDEEIYQLIMASGFSTSEEVSDISGRGVGLDVVKNTIESLGGSITIDSSLGEGSTFSIRLPLTLSIVSVLLVELNMEKYGVPLSNIVETVVVHKNQVIQAHHNKLIDFRGKVIPLIFLHDVFQVPESKNVDNDYVSIVVIQKGEKMTGLVVDSFIGQQEVVLKSLGNYLTNVFAISGATILGDGEVTLIIDSTAFIN